MITFGVASLILSIAGVLFSIVGLVLAIILDSNLFTPLGMMCISLVMLFHILERRREEARKKIRWD